MIEIFLKQTRAEAARLRRDCKQISSAIATLQNLLHEKQRQLHIANAVLKFKGVQPGAPTSFPVPRRQISNRS